MSFVRLEEAITVATEWHRGQFRDGDHSLPYITHPVEVLTYLRHVGKVVDEDLLCVAALHDILEETKIDPASIDESFGARVGALVRELTRREPGPSETEGLSKEEIWRLRAGILVGEISRMSSDAQQVKLADRLANVRDAKRTKSGPKVARYLGQTTEILKVVPRKVNQPLWEAIQAEL